MRIRSLLYVPVSSERFLAKAHERGADAIILDLEDAVAPAQKDAARARLPEAVAMAGRRGERASCRYAWRPPSFFAGWAGPVPGNVLIHIGQSRRSW